MARANPERTLESILNAKDRTEALERLTAALRRTWEAAYSAGFLDGVDDATANNPRPRRANPYDKEGK